MARRGAELEHDSEADAKKKGVPKGARNKGTPKRAQDKRMTPKQAGPPETKYPWGDKWNHPENPAIFEGDTDDD